MGRPKIYPETTPVGCRIKITTNDKLAEMALLLDTNVNRLINEAIDEYIAKFDRDGAKNAYKARLQKQIDDLIRRISRTMISAVMRMSAGDSKNERL